MKRRRKQSRNLPEQTLKGHGQTHTTRVPSTHKALTEKRKKKDLTEENENRMNFNLPIFRLSRFLFVCPGNLIRSVVLCENISRREDRCIIHFMCFSLAFGVTQTTATRARDLNIYPCGREGPFSQKLFSISSFRDLGMSVRS